MYTIAWNQLLGTRVLAWYLLPLLLLVMMLEDTGKTYPLFETISRAMLGGWNLAFVSYASVC